MEIFGITPFLFEDLGRNPLEIVIVGDRPSLLRDTRRKCYPFDMLPYPFLEVYIIEIYVFLGIDVFYDHRVISFSLDL